MSDYNELHMQAFSAHRLVNYIIKTHYVERRSQYGYFFIERCKSIIIILQMHLNKQ